MILPIPIQVEIFILFGLILITFFVLWMVIRKVEKRVKMIFGGSGDFVLTYFDLQIPPPGSAEAGNKEEVSTTTEATSIGDHTEALIDEIPSDLNEFAKFMEAIRPLDPEALKPDLEPGSDTSRKIVSDTYGSPKFNVQYYLKVGEINFILPDGKVIEGDLRTESSINLPAGTRIVTSHIGSSYLDINRNGQPVGVSMLWDSEVELEEVQEGSVDNIKVNKGWARFYPQGPIQVQTADGVKVTNQQTDFGVGYDPAARQTVVEIYNGKVSVESSVGKRELTSAYGSEIKRVEIEEGPGANLEEKIAIPKSQWPAFLVNQKNKEIAESQPKPAAGAGKPINLPLNLRIAILNLALLLAALTSFYLYQKSYRKV